MIMGGLQTGAMILGLAFGGWVVGRLKSTGYDLGRSTTKGWVPKLIGILIISDQCFNEENMTIFREEVYVSGLYNAVDNIVFTFLCLLLLYSTPSCWG